MSVQSMGEVWKDSYENFIHFFLEDIDRMSQFAVWPILHAENGLLINDLMMALLIEI